MNAFINEIKSNAGWITIDAILIGVIVLTIATQYNKLAAAIGLIFS